MDNKVIYISGMYPKQSKVEWIKANVSINIDMLEKELTKLKSKANNGFLNIALCESKAGKLYFKLDDFKPKEVTSTEHSPDRDDLPF